jgi:MATE family multidrug resistance protein
VIFSSSGAVIDAVDNISVLLALTILLNGIQPVLSGMPSEIRHIHMVA